jgi:hypothetical protein
MGGSHRKLLPILAGTPSAGTTLPREPAATAPRRTFGTYVYCVVRGATAPAVAVREARLPGADGPRVVPLGVRTWLVVADVPLTIYGEKALEGRLKDLDWVAAVGVAHQAMVDACLRHDAVVPMKVFTIFTSLDRARDEMQRHADQLRSVMQQVAGCVEWGVRITRAPQPARKLARRVAREQFAPPADDRASGRAFLESKVRQRHAVREETEALDRHVRTLTDTLHDVTRDVRYRLDAAQSSVPVLLDAAYLVPRRSEKRFREQVRTMARPLLACGCRVTVTGPWPAYSFVSPTGR